MACRAVLLQRFSRLLDNGVELPYHVEDWGHFEANDEKKAISKAMKKIPKFFWDWIEIPEIGRGIAFARRIPGSTIIEKYMILVACNGERFVASFRKIAFKGR